MSATSEDPAAPSDPLTAAWQKHLRGGRSEETGVPTPVWVPDTASISCMHCNKAFGMLRRRHHCRRCGALVCGDCSDARVSAQLIKADARMQILASEHGDRLRICSKCTKVIDFRIIKNLKSRGFRRQGEAGPPGSPSSPRTSGDSEYESFSSMMQAEHSPTPTKEPGPGRKAHPLTRNPASTEVSSMQAPLVNSEEEARKEAQRKRFREERAAMMRRLKGGEDEKRSDDVRAVTQAPKLSEERDARPLGPSDTADPMEEGSGDWDEGDIASI